MNKQETKSSYSSYYDICSGLQTLYMYFCCGTIFKKRMNINSLQSAVVTHVFLFFCSHEEHGTMDSWGLENVVNQANTHIV